MGGSKSKQEAMRNGISNHHRKISPTIPLQIPLVHCNGTKIRRESRTLELGAQATAIAPKNEFHGEIGELHKVPVTKSSAFDFNFSPKQNILKPLPKEAFYTTPVPSISKIPVSKTSMVFTQKPMHDILNAKIEMDGSGAGDCNANYIVNTVHQITTKPMPIAVQSSYSRKDVTFNTTAETAVSVSESDGKKKKLVIRGLKRFCESRGSSCPPTWVKEFPCKSKFHPDKYVYDWDEGPNAVKRNTPLMSQCSKKGGRCGTCGIYAVDVCRSCRKCDLDCGCPKLPKIPDFVSQLIGSGATWPQSEKTSRDFAGEEQARQYGVPAPNYNQYYTNQPQFQAPPPFYPSYQYYPPMQYSIPTVYPGCYPTPPTYMPMPMMSPQPPVPSNYYTPPPQDSTNYGQATNPQTSFNMSFYE